MLCYTYYMYIIIEVRYLVVVSFGDTHDILQELIFNGRRYSGFF